MDWREMVHAADDLSGLRLKTVLTYLTGIYPLRHPDTENTDQGRVVDVVGRGIDFSFRLEKFAGATHIVINDMFLQGLKDSIQKDKEQDKPLCDCFHKYGGYEVIPCKRAMKGWSDPGGELFHILVNLETLEKEVTLTPSVYDGGVFVELFNIYRKHRKTQNSILKKDAEDLTAWEKGTNGGL